MSSYPPFTPGKGLKVSVTDAADQRTAFPSAGGNTLILYNSGASTIYWAVGSVTIQAAVPSTSWVASACPLAPGTTQSYTVPEVSTALYLGYICGTGLSSVLEANLGSGE
jgi:hypothetical protein